MVVSVSKKIIAGKERGEYGACCHFIEDGQERFPSDKVICDQREKYIRKLAIWVLREVCSGREKSKCKGPEAGRCLISLRSSKEGRRLEG